MTSANACLHVRLTQAVADAITGATLSESVTANRVYDTEQELEDLKTLRCDVVMGDEDSEIGTRNSTQGDLHVDVALRQKVDRNNIDRLDALRNLLQEIQELLFQTPRLPNATAACWQGCKVAAPYVPDHLRVQGQYTGILRLTYRAYEGGGDDAD